MDKEMLVDSKVPLRVLFHITITKTFLFINYIFFKG